MTSHGCKGKEPFTFMPNTPHFFKIILQGTLDEQKLMIPAKFVRYHGEHLQNQAILKVPGDSTWKVELEKCNGKVWLKKGWKEFTDYYSLVHGHFLVFEYRGNSEFYVLIFDNTATEIDYPLRSADHELPHYYVEDSDSEDDTSVQILEDSSSLRKKRERSPLPSPNPRKTIKMDPTSKTSAIENRSSNSSVPEAGKPYPFFKIVMRCSCYHYVSVPKSFLEKYVMHEKQEMQLQVGDNSWPVKLNYYPAHGSGQFAAGWMTFARGNSLQIPVKFVRNHGDDLQHMANLKVSGGDSTWKIGLEECDGKVWMKRGWKEFTENYSLAYEQCSVFEYRGKSDFDVFILGGSGAEMPHQDVEDSDSDDESIEILESCSFSRKKRKRSPLPILGRLLKLIPPARLHVIFASSFEIINATGVCLKLMI